MKVLVLGDSDSGAALGGVAWPQLVEARLAEAGDDEAEVTSVNFSAVPATAAEYGERRVREIGPDLVVLLVSTSGFTFRFVEARVRRIFGRRAARWAKRVESGFEAVSRGPTGETGRVNRVGRGLARGVVGTEPLTSRGDLTRNYEDVLMALARFEELDVVALVYPGMGDHARRGNAPAERQLFLADIRRAVESHRFGWLLLNDVFGDSADARRYMLDGLHFNAAGQEAIAGAVFEMVAARSKDRRNGGGDEG